MASGDGESREIDIPRTTTPDSGYNSEFNSQSGNLPVVNDNHDTVDSDDDRNGIEHNPRIFALIVAVDVYRSARVHNLSGCANDAREFEAFLKDVLRVPDQRIMTLCNAEATRYAIIDAFKKHLLENREIQDGDALVFFFSGHGSYGRASDVWSTEHDRIELICPYDYLTEDHNEAKWGIPDRTLSGLMHRLASRKSDNITVILDCCHSGGMSRDLDQVKVENHNLMPVRSPSDCTVRSAPVCTIPVPWELDREIWDHVSGSARDMLSQSSSRATYNLKAMATHVLLAACRSTEQAKEELCHYKSTNGMRQDVRGVFSAKLITMLRDLGREGLKNVTYSRLMEQLSRPAGPAPSSSSLFPILSLASQHPQCDGIHKDRVLFSTRRLPDIPDSFIMEKVGSTWQVLAGTLHGIAEGTQFGIPRVAADPQTPNIALEATNVRPLTCEVRCPNIAGALLNSSNRERVVVTDWHQPDTLATNVYVRSPDVIQGLPRNSSSASTLYRIRTDDRIVPDLTLDRLIQSSSSGWRVERLDPLVAHFCTGSRALDIVPHGARNASYVLDAISQFNFHLYRFNAADVDKQIHLTVQLHALQETIETFCDALKINRHYEVGLRLVEGIALAVHHHDDTVYYPERDGERRVSRQAHSTFSIPRSVQQAVITNFDHRYGFTLVNHSGVDLFPYVFFFDPHTYAIQNWYSPPWKTGEAPLSANGGHLRIGYGGSGIDELRFAHPGAHPYAAVGFLKIFVATCYVDLNIEQLSLFGPPVENRPLLKPRAKAVHMNPVPLRDNWNAWVYVLTSQPTAGSI
ncbi:hypothetical protein EVJ58_g3722 [Rhodofomes roseus]|uniref:Peptidase C14 caspase domain-containing protein n=1 Tax=Rhodofomes roseus TaxID=34475 RepID=A0A4Y9YLI4_9APHY|nr:hypothetical protein EVJ58_g3722 [Rhodofomes roseus]